MGDNHSADGGNTGGIRWLDGLPYSSLASRDVNFKDACRNFSGMKDK